MKLTAFAKKLVDDSPLKRTAIAKECGISPLSFTQVLNGHAHIGLPVLKHLARVLNVAEQDLVAHDIKQNNTSNTKTNAA